MTKSNLTVLVADIERYRTKMVEMKTVPSRKDLKLLVKPVIREAFTATRTKRT